MSTYGNDKVRIFKVFDKESYKVLLVAPSWANLYFVYHKFGGLFDLFNIKR
ncbi:hypothetical protein AALB_3491 [Agarivorans albus MKT 106]|uniref:Uncharacterized protein n=1 Tax=Agarivorans albus MKT 106 TaxID=1331007 RepID=R9PU21_AGAAL|nr:hypothetical protein AALB_3491 [Agarivorans albus MKT 106]